MDNDKRKQRGRKPKEPKATVVEAPPEGALLLTVGQVAWLLQFSVSSVQRLSRDPNSGLPMPVKIGLQQHRWHRSDIEAYIASRPPAPWGPE